MSGRLRIGDNGPADESGLQPGIDERRLADASEGDEAEDIRGGVVPGGGQLGTFGFAADEGGGPVRGRWEMETAGAGPCATE